MKKISLVSKKFQQKCRLLIYNLVFYHKLIHFVASLAIDLRGYMLHVTASNYPIMNFPSISMVGLTMHMMYLDYHSKCY